MRYATRTLVCVVVAAGLVALAPAPTLASLDDGDVVGAWDLGGHDTFRIKKTLTDRSRDARVGLEMNTDHTCVLDIEGQSLPCAWEIVRGRRLGVTFDHAMLEDALWGAFADLLWYEFGIPHSDVDLALEHTRVQARINARGRMKLKVKCNGDCDVAGHHSRRFQVRATLRGYRD